MSTLRVFLWVTPALGVNRGILPSGESVPDGQEAYPPVAGQPSMNSITEAIAWTEPKEEREMMVRSFLKNLSRSSQEPYQVIKLVNSKVREDMAGQPLHFICDIDKTYLETDFDTPLSLAKIAFEHARDKVTVPGATDVLLLARWGDVVQGERLFVEGSSEAHNKGSAILGEEEVRPRCLHFVSSSPPQLRSVLEEKLSLDGLDWTSDTFKDQVYNIRMGRMDLLRQHVAYKSLAILSLVERADPGSRFVLIGDNAESDIFIYWGVQLLLDEMVSPAGYLDFIAQSGVEPQLLNDLRDFLSQARHLMGGQGPRKKRVEGIYIRMVPGGSGMPEDFPWNPICSFESFFQVGLDFMARGWVSPEAMKPLVRTFHNQHGVDLPVLEQQALKTLFLGEGDGLLGHKKVIQQFDRVWSTLTHQTSQQAQRSWRTAPRRDSIGAITEESIVELAGRLVQWIHSRKSLKGRIDQ